MSFHVFVFPVYCIFDPKFGLETVSVSWFQCDCLSRLIKLLSKWSSIKIIILTTLSVANFFVCVSDWLNLILSLKVKGEVLRTRSWLAPLLKLGTRFRSQSVSIIFTSRQTLLHRLTFLTQTRNCCSWFIVTSFLKVCDFISMFFFPGSGKK